MGRRGGARGRPGLLFILIFVVFIVIFYYTWKYVVSSDSTVSSRYKTIAQNQAQSNFEILQKDLNRQIEHKWQQDRSDMRLHGSDRDQAEERDPDYNLGQAPLSERLRSTAATTSKPPAEKASEGSEVYREPNKSIQETLSQMERIVHLDLKGAAPKMSYLEELIPYLAQLGATGLLVEYEDMFPYTGKLENIAAKNAYTKEDISRFLTLTERYELQVIPLIQTFGHMEFVLKSESLMGARESNHTPQVIDITSAESNAIITEMVRQVLDAHQDASYLHIGCDEVYELGRGKSKTLVDSLKLSETDIFLQHVEKVASIVKEKDVTPIMWDDELRHVNAEAILQYKLPSMVDIMIWTYTPNVMERVNSTVWEKYSQLFKHVWIASAFKGATGSRQFFTEPMYHLQNHYSWLEAIAANQKHISFQGIVLTGWQRYDHFATLCELLPVAVPSLAVCLATMTEGGFTEMIHWNVSSKLKCERNVELTFPPIDRKTHKAIVTQDCRFPGHALYHSMQEFYGYTKMHPTHRLDGWLSDYHIAHGFSNPGQLRVLSKDLLAESTGYAQVLNPLRSELSKIYSKDTVEEWIEEHVTERLRRNQELQDKVTALLKHTSWERRPLPPPELRTDGKKVINTGAADSPSGTDQKQRDINRQELTQKRRNLPDDQRGYQEGTGQGIARNRQPSLQTNSNRQEDHVQGQSNNVHIEQSSSNQNQASDGLSKLLRGSNRVAEQAQGMSGNFQAGQSNNVQFMSHNEPNQAYRNAAGLGPAGEQPRNFPNANTDNNYKPVIRVGTGREQRQESQPGGARYSDLKPQNVPKTDEGERKIETMNREQYQHVANNVNGNRQSPDRQFVDVKKDNVDRNINEGRNNQGVKYEGDKSAAGGSQKDATTSRNYKESTHSPLSESLRNNNFPPVDPWDKRRKDDKEPYAADTVLEGENHYDKLRRAKYEEDAKAAEAFVKESYQRQANEEEGGDNDDVEDIKSPNGEQLQLQRRFGDTIGEDFKDVAMDEYEKALLKGKAW